MNERYVILNLGKGYFTGVNYDTNEPCFSFEITENSSFVLFKTEYQAFKRLSEMMVELKNVRGLYEVKRLTFIQ